MADEFQAMRTIQRAMLERKLRRKATVEGFLLLASVASAFVLAPDPKAELLWALLVAGIGLPLYIVRRSADLRRLARADDWRARAVEGRGISLAGWHAGASLPAWPDRRELPDRK